MVVAVCIDLDRAPGAWWWMWFAEVYRQKVRAILTQSTLATAARLIEMLDQTL